MAVKRVKSNMDIVTAAKKRIKNVFSNGVPVYMSFSGGKDSIVLADLVYKLIQAGEIDPSLLTVIFIDEEAIFDCIEQTTKTWRRKFMLAGAKFQWWCIEVKHFSCFNELSNDESFVCWDSQKKNVWVRQPPPFAIRNHPLFKPRQDSYQAFLPRICKDGIMLTGVRAAESVQRLQYMAALGVGGKGITKSNTIYPVYDWKTVDVWLYLQRERVDIPEVYLQMYQTGINRNQLRVSQFFSVDTVPSLVHLAEYDPSLMERILRREPNAYIAILYWDSEMFHRSTKTRRELEGEVAKDYRAILRDMLFVQFDTLFDTQHKRHVATQYRKLFLRMDGMARPRDYRKLYEGLMAGDPKLRTLRAIYQDISCAYADYAKRFRKGGEMNG
ncbi:phosphoadenosine phosphosulfate reductase family protein [Bengtsoniella intestinalis]|uniref:phosphoadenosine phosphosulfate reductase domain-containing protein n=1 Tax=Bengtsoniella intestinalis TaxID=3073143 RepID=UPI00391F7851